MGLVRRISGFVLLRLSRNSYNSTKRQLFLVRFFFGKLYGVLHFAAFSAGNNSTVPKTLVIRFFYLNINLRKTSTAKLLFIRQFGLEVEQIHHNHSITVLREKSGNLLPFTCLLYILQHTICK